MVFFVQEKKVFSSTPNHNASLLPRWSCLPSDSLRLSFICGQHTKSKMEKYLGRVRLGEYLEVLKTSQSAITDDLRMKFLMKY